MRLIYGRNFDGGIDDWIIHSSYSTHFFNKLNLWIFVYSEWMMVMQKQ